MNFKTIGFAVTGSFCTFKKVLPQMRALVSGGYNVIPIMSNVAYSTDTRFGRAADFVAAVEEICGRSVIKTIEGAEPIGPKKLLDALIIAPATGNSIAKIACGITDTPVTMAAKAHLRNARPLLIAISTNDGLGTNAANIASLLVARNVYFVPYRQDDPTGKPNSLVADMDSLMPALIAALEGHQLQPILA
ncbi:MAG: dipicolinate synthase subunit B [Clostridia bacterium]